MCSDLEYKLDFLRDILLVYTASMGKNASKGDIIHKNGQSK